MKRLAVLLLALLYLAAGAGFTLRTHYCMGERLAVRFGHLPQAGDGHHCPRCGMEKKGSGGCCHDELKFFKCCTDQVPAEVLYLPAGHCTAGLPNVPPAFPAAPAATPSLAPDFFPEAHQPSGGPPLYLQLRRLLI